MAPKQKFDKIDMAELFASGGDSWADDEMPVASSHALGGTDAWGGSGISAQPAVALPTRPPFTARLFNLPYDLTESQISGFFVDRKLCPASTRVPKDPGTDRIKGYAFVEFDDRESLASAIALDGQQMSGRPVRIAVAENRGGSGGFDTPSNWRSGTRGPLDPLEGGFRGGSRGGYRDEEPELNWGARTGPLAPLTDAERREQGMSFGGPRRERQFRPRDEEPELNWGARTGPLAPLSDAERRAQGNFGNGPRRERQFKAREPEPEFDWSRRKAPAPAASANAGASAGASASASAPAANRNAGPKKAGFEVLSNE